MPFLIKLNSHHPLNSNFHAAVQSRLDRFIAAQHDLLALTGDRLDLVWDQVRHFAGGGKRIRPAFCYWGYVAATEGNEEPSKAVLDVAASLDLLHMSALIHDDLVDDSDTRRGGPSAHRLAEAVHRNEHWQGDSEHFGKSAAVLLGDILFTWSVSMAEQASLSKDQLKRARPYLDVMRSEVLAGQFLDLFAETKPLSAEDVIADARMVMEYKTAKYTVARPVQIGAALGMANEDMLQSLGVFGNHIGQAFQMRDDVLGVFGDPEVTGKPAGDDIRAGKKTLMIGYALRDATPNQVIRLENLLGKQDLRDSEIEQARHILVSSGAVQNTEKAIAAEAAAGMRLLNRLHLSAEGTQALMGLVHASVERTA
ncbi:MAG: polyprenyl synthetase family protein [Propionibacteriaceae bacterium]|nr:polyprenyl synthetase family protein [Propionibacteriaceae bacterium]